jgi:glutamate-1-semialdehyde 2,1-aminomutase
MKKESLQKTSQPSVIQDSVENYKLKTKLSYKMYAAASKIMPGGQSHNARFFEPYPFFATKARGKYIWDLDGNRYVDYWMGHTALILGHSPQIVVKEIRSQMSNGLLFGSPNEFAYEHAKLVTELVPCAEEVRFCTTGGEATMYAVRLARAFTKRKTILKMAGGWHGYNSALAVGVNAPYEVPESAGLVSDEDKTVGLAPFNDIEGTRKAIESCGEELAGVIIEPVIGAGGIIPAEKEYLSFLRSECTRVGAVLIFDEIITGFRMGLHCAQGYYGIKPDLCTLGKILGGGLPASAVAGRSDIMSLADVTNKSKTERCWIGGGTFSENSLPMRAGRATLEYLKANEKGLYPRLSKLGEKARRTVDKAFEEFDIRTQSTGTGSLFSTHFLSEGQKSIKSPFDVNASNRGLQKKYAFSLISDHGIYFLPGHSGAISSAHTDADIVDLAESTRVIAKRLASNE